MKDDSVAENPELLDFLASEMMRVNYDLKEYLRILLNTKTYQREASTAEFNEDEPYNFAVQYDDTKFTPESVQKNAGK